MPSLPGIDNILEIANEINCFININQLEFSDTNYLRMISNGYYLKNDFSNVAISKINIYNILGKYNDLKYNYCSSVYKDAGQLKERLLRIARKNKKFYETITKEGTFIYIVIILLKRNIFDFIKKYLLKEKYFISNKIDDQIIKYLNISETKISLFNLKYK